MEVCGDQSLLATHILQNIFLQWTEMLLYIEIFYKLCWMLSFLWKGNIWAPNILFIITTTWWLSSWNCVYRRTVTVKKNILGIFWVLIFGVRCLANFDPFLISPWYGFVSQTWQPCFQAFPNARNSLRTNSPRDTQMSIYVFYNHLKYQQVWYSLNWWNDNL